MHSFLVPIPPDIKPSSDVLEITPDTSIGIEEVRQIQTFLSRKPLQSENNTVIIHQAEKLTLPAQHALLKTLEEPPGNSQIFLVTSFPDQLLPTILSRVQLSHASAYQPIDTSTLQKSWDLFNRLLSAKGVGEKLKIIDSAAFTRETALDFLDHLEHILHNSIISPHPPLKLRGGDEGVLFSLITDTRKYLKANVNLRLALDHFVMNL